MGLNPVYQTTRFISDVNVFDPHLNELWCHVYDAICFDAYGLSSKVASYFLNNTPGCSKACILGPVIIQNQHKPAFIRIEPNNSKQF